MDASINASVYVCNYSMYDLCAHVECVCVCVHVCNSMPTIVSYPFELTNLIHGKK